MPPEKPRRYQRGPHIYPRKLRSGAVVWYAYTPARPKGVSLGTHDPAVAEQRFRAILAGALTESDVGGDPSERTIRQVIAAFTDAPHGYTSRTRQSITNRLAAFGTWAEGKGAVLPSEITPGLLDAWIRTPGTVARTAVFKTTDQRREHTRIGERSQHRAESGAR